MGQKKRLKIDIKNVTFQFKLTQLCSVSLSDVAAGSDDEWGVEDVEAGDVRSVEALGALRSGHGDVEDDAEAGQELDS